MSCLLGQNREIFFPKPSHDLQLTSFSDIASRYLEQLGYTPYPCSSEEEAREKASALIADKKWPCYFFSSDTTGEKSYEEFFTEREILDMARFQNIGIIKNDPAFDEQALNSFLDGIQKLNQNGRWEKIEIVSLFEAILPEFSHLETGKYLDGRM